MRKNHATDSMVEQGRGPAVEKIQSAEFGRASLRGEGVVVVEQEVAEGEREREAMCVSCQIIDALPPRLGKGTCMCQGRSVITHQSRT